MKSKASTGRTKTRKSRKTRKRTFFSSEKQVGSPFFESTASKQADAPGIQRDLPQIALPQGDSIPSLPGLTAEQRSALLRLVQNYHENPSRDTGQAAVNAVTSLLEARGTVQYHGQDHIDAASPRFVRRPGMSAIDAGASQASAGITYGFRGKNRVDIFGRAFTGETNRERLGFLAGTIVHEYIHVLQNQAPNADQQSNAEREYQAWLWQAQHIDQMGIFPSSVASRFIGVQLRDFFNMLPDEVQSSQEETFRAARINLNRPREESAPSPNTQ